MDFGGKRPCIRRTDFGFYTQYNKQIKTGTNNKRARERERERERERDHNAKTLH